MIKTIIILLIINFSIMTVSGQNTLYISVGDKTMTATLTDNEATKKLKNLLAEGSVTISMNEYGGFEKVGTLPWSLPTSNGQITTSPGDIMLYQGNNIVFFYGTNSWSYTPLGKFDNTDTSELKSFLSGDRITVKLSMSTPSGLMILYHQMLLKS